jgi:hypothetical protein
VDRGDPVPGRRYDPVMLRLTLRSGRDGRFLARVVETGGRPFVLDFGDRRVMADLVQRISRGFTMIRAGRLVHVHPEDEDLVPQLAAFYAAEGALVFLEEPTWRGRPSAPSLPEALPDLDEEDEPTEMLALADLPEVDEALTTLLPDEEEGPAPAPAPAPVGFEVPAEPEPTVEVGLLPGVPTSPPEGR